MFCIHAVARRLSLASSIVLAFLSAAGVNLASAADASTVKPSPMQPGATVQPIKTPVPVATPAPMPPQPQTAHARRAGPGTQTEDDAYVGAKAKASKVRKANGVRGGDDDLDDLEVERLRNKPGAK